MPPNPPIYPLNPNGFVDVLAHISKAGGRRGRVTAQMAAVAPAGTVVPAALLGLKHIEAVIDLTDGGAPGANAHMADITAAVPGALVALAADGSSVTITHGNAAPATVTFAVEGVF